MEKLDLLETMISAASGHVKSELTAPECSNMMISALNKYTEQLDLEYKSRQHDLLIDVLRYAMPDNYTDMALEKIVGQFEKERNIT